MKKLQIVYSENKIEIKNWEKFSLVELLEMAGIFTYFVSKRFRSWQSEPEIDDKFIEYNIGNKTIKEWKCPPNQG
jgi:hypothetical protein